MEHAASAQVAHTAETLHTCSRRQVSLLPPHPQRASSTFYRCSEKRFLCSCCQLSEEQEQEEQQKVDVTHSSAGPSGWRAWTRGGVFSLSGVMTASCCGAHAAVSLTHPTDRGWRPAPQLQAGRVGADCGWWDVVEGGLPTLFVCLLISRQEMKSGAWFLLLLRDELALHVPAAADEQPPPTIT